MTVASSIRDYQVAFVESMAFLDECERLKDRFYVIDQKVWELYQPVFGRLDQEHVLILPIREEVKSLDTVTQVYNALIKSAAKRNMTLISVGGGIVQDITGFVASTLYRGINWIYVPTTLLAQADSCIGSKTSLNYQNYKNLIGTFYPPIKIYIHTAFLATLDPDDFYSGLGEVVKLYMMGGKASVLGLIQEIHKIKARDQESLRNAIRDVLRIKLQYIQEDEFDTGRRNLLNFGHCLGHALESTTNFAIPHGQAVLIGIIFGNIVSRNRGLLSSRRNDFFNEELLLNSVHVNRGVLTFSAKRIFEAMKMDKKRVGDGLALIMMRDDYSMVKIQDLQQDELLASVKELGEVLDIPVCE